MSSEKFLSRRGLLGGAAALGTVGFGLFKLFELVEEEKKDLVSEIFKNREVLKRNGIIINTEDEAVTFFTTLEKDVEKVLKVLGTDYAGESLRKTFTEVVNDLINSNRGKKTKYSTGTVLHYLVETFKKVDQYKKTSELVYKIFPTPKDLMEKLSTTPNASRIFLTDEDKSKILLLKGKLPDIIQGGFEKFTSEILNSMTSSNPIYLHPIAMATGVPDGHIWNKFNSRTEAELAFLQASIHLSMLLK